MAATKRRKGGRRRARARANPVNPVNPTRRRRTRRRRSVTARRRNPINPTRHRRHARRRHTRRHHRNPAGVLGKAFTLAAGGALIGLVQPFIGRFVLPYVGASPLTNAGLAFGTGWLLSLAAGMTGFTRKYKDDLLLAGGVVAAAQLISAYVVPAIRRAAPAGNGMGRRGFNGIGIMTNIPPNAVLPPPPPQVNGGMQGIGMRPNQYAQ